MIFQRDDDAARGADLFLPCNIVEHVAVALCSGVFSIDFVNKRSAQDGMLVKSHRKWTVVSEDGDE